MEQCVYVVNGFNYISKVPQALSDTRLIGHEIKMLSVYTVERFYTTLKGRGPYTDTLTVVLNFFSVGTLVNEESISE